MSEFEQREIGFWGNDKVWITYLDDVIINSTQLADGSEWEDDPYHPVYSEVHMASKTVGLDMNETIKLLRKTDTRIKYNAPIRKS